MKVLDRAKQLEVRDVLVTKMFISATVVSSSKKTNYTPIFYWEDMSNSCGCMSWIRDELCKHVVALLLKVDRRDLIERLLENDKTKI